MLFQGRFHRNAWEALGNKLCRGADHDSVVGSDVENMEACLAAAECVQHGFSAVAVVNIGPQGSIAAWRGHPGSGETRSSRLHP